MGFIFWRTFEFLMKLSKSLFCNFFQYFFSPEQWKNTFNMLTTEYGSDFFTNMFTTVLPVPLAARRWVHCIYLGYISAAAGANVHVKIKCTRHRPVDMDANQPPRHSRCRTYVTPLFYSWVCVCGWFEHHEFVLSLSAGFCQFRTTVA